MTTATLEKINTIDLKDLVPVTDYSEIKKISLDEGKSVLEISIKEDGVELSSPSKTDDYVDLEITLRKGIRVGFFKK